MAKRYLFVDFEFTMPENDKKRRDFVPEIIEAGVVFVSDNQVIETFTSFVKPEINSVLTECCKQFCGIEQADVDSGFSFVQLVSKLAKYNERGHMTIVTWGNMDMYVLRKQCHYWNLPFPFTGDELDLSMEHKRFYGEQNQSGLMKALLEFGKPTDRKHHRALDDALTTFEIFKLVEKDKEYLNRTECTTIGEIVDFSRLFTKLA
jgi:sporulation inhibitor KapD